MRNCCIRVFICGLRTWMNLPSRAVPKKGPWNGECFLCLLQQAVGGSQLSGQSTGCANRPAAGSLLCHCSHGTGDKLPTFLGSASSTKEPHDRSTHRLTGWIAGSRKRLHWLTQKGGLQAELEALRPGLRAIRILSEEPVGRLVRVWCGQSLCLPVRVIFQRKRESIWQVH